MNTFSNLNSSVKRNILVVEDDFINREILKEILCSKYNVIEAVDGVDGLEKLEINTNSISLILLDVQMPRMNGYDFLKKYHSNEKFLGIPVIVTTSSGDEEEEKCLELGATDFSRKPYKPNILIQRINRLIELRESTKFIETIKLDPVSGLYVKSIFERKFVDDFSSFENHGLIYMSVDNYAVQSFYYGEKSFNRLLSHIGKILRSFGEPDLISCKYSETSFIIAYDMNKFDAEILVKQIDNMLADDKFANKVKTVYSYYENITKEDKIADLEKKLIFASKQIVYQYNNNFIKYEDELSKKANKIRIIEDNMENALLNEEIKVFYQPKVDPYTNKICGAEALVRWIHPILGFISPGEFIPIFEDNGFIVKVDAYVWKHVLDDICEWKKKGYPLVPISINLSRKDFVFTSIINEMIESVDAKDVDKDLLHVELTESACADTSNIFPIIETIRSKGFKIEIDDFGSGYSSLGMIKEMPMDILKLDIVFARSIEKQKEVVEMIINLAHALEVKIVAEGVETSEQLGILKNMNCDYIQGYYYSKPLPKNEFVDYLLEH